MPEPDQNLLDALSASFPDFISQTVAFKNGVADDEAMMDLYHAYPDTVRVLDGLHFGADYRAFNAKHNVCFREGARARMAATFFRHGFAPQQRPHYVRTIVLTADTDGRVAIVHAQGGRMWVCCEVEADAVALALALSF